MNRQWMNADRRSKEYVDGMRSFLKVAKANKTPKGFMCCHAPSAKTEMIAPTRGLFTST
jgi:hypothetical protein